MHRVRRRRWITCASQHPSGLRATRGPVARRREKRVARVAGLAGDLRGVRRRLGAGQRPVVDTTVEYRDQSAVALGEAKQKNVPRRRVKSEGR